MLSCEVQLTRLAAGNSDHRFASCCIAFCSSFTQLLTDWSAERPAVAATSSLQLRAMSNFGTPSATGKTSCEFKMIIENEIGIPNLPCPARQYCSASCRRRFDPGAAAPAYAKSERERRECQNVAGAGQRRPDRDALHRGHPQRERERRSRYAALLPS